MTDKNIILEPEVIQEISFPSDTQATESNSNNSKSTSETQTPESTSTQTFPKAIIAKDVISSSFNTQQKRILAEFSFNESGAIAIGKYIEGISGDLRLTENGIVARNRNGQTTFSLDGTTGDATFLGTLAAGSLIAGNFFVVAESGNRRGLFINDGTYDVIFMGLELS